MGTERSQLLDQKQATQLLGLSPRTLEAWRLTGGGPIYIKVGRRVRYRRSETGSLARRAPENIDVRSWQLGECGVVGEATHGDLSIAYCSEDG